MTSGHTRCSRLCVPMKYQVTTYVAPTLPMNICEKCGSAYNRVAFHACDSSGGHRHNVYAAGLAYGDLKDPRYRDMIKALAEQYSAIPLAEIIKDLLAGRGAQ